MTSAISLDACKTEALLGILGIRGNLFKKKKKKKKIQSIWKKKYGYMGYQDQINMIKSYLLIRIKWRWFGLDVVVVLLILMVLKSPCLNFTVTSTILHATHTNIANTLKHKKHLFIG